MRLELVFSLSVYIIAKTVETRFTEECNSFPHNPFTGPKGTSLMHKDAGSSDTTWLPGPSSGPILSSFTILTSVCPIILIGSDKHLLLLCKTIPWVSPIIYLHSENGNTLAKFHLTKGSLLESLYAYVDHQDRLVVSDASRHILRIAHHLTDDGTWELYVNSTISLEDDMSEDEYVVGLAPDWQGRVWFATSGGTVGTADDTRHRVRTMKLPTGEHIANSISTCPVGSAVATTHALYFLNVTKDGLPAVVWRRGYDRGPGRKPGQLSWGTGSTPTFFGTRDGTEYLTIVDNAAPTVSLLVYKSSSGDLVCSVPILKQGGSGSENSPIGVGNSVFVASTYGYPYTRMPEDAGDSVPQSASFLGGMSRVGVFPNGSGCELVWDNDIRSAALPQISLGDGLIHTVLRSSSYYFSFLDTFSYAQIDPRDGTIVREEELGTGFWYNPLQTVGLISSEGIYYQGTLVGLFKIYNSRIRDEL